VDLSDPSREAIHEALQEHMPRGEDALLTGWVIVAEWVDHEGERWLSKGHAASTSSWTAKGMLHEALNGDWPDGEQGGA
jgi:hypothetical protein